MPIPPHTATVAGIRFESLGGTPGYVSMNQHRGGSRSSKKNKWAVPPPVEYEIFARSHRGGWTCSRLHNWSIQPGLAVIGKNDECIAKFPGSSNTTDDRHGYPVSALDHQRLWEHRPPPELTHRWVQSSLITDLQKKRIDKGKV